MESSLTELPQPKPLKTKWSIKHNFWQKATFLATMGVVVTALMQIFVASFLQTILLLALTGIGLVVLVASGILAQRYFIRDASLRLRLMYDQPRDEDREAIEWAKAYENAKQKNELFKDPLEEK